MTTESKLQTTTGFNQSPCQIHQFLHYRSDATPLGRMLNRGNLAKQANLANESKAIVVHSAHGHHQAVCGKLTAGEALQIEICLELAVILFAQGVITVESV